MLGDEGIPDEEIERVTTTTRLSTQIRLPQELHQRLTAAAEGYGLPLNFVIVKACEDFLDRMIPPSEFRLTRPSAPVDRPNPTRRTGKLDPERTAARELAREIVQDRRDLG